MAHLPRPSYMGEPENQYGELDLSLAVQVTDTRKNLLDSFNQIEAENSAQFDSSDQIRVYLRLRPFTEEELRRNEDQDCFEVKDSQHVVLKPPSDSILFKNDNQRGMGKSQHEFSFTKVFPPSTSQEDFFNNTTQDLIKDFVAGQNSLIFTYGVTNAGKTYTIQGTSQEQGILPRALEMVFTSIRGRQFDSMSVMPKMYNSVGRLTEDMQIAQQQLKDSVMKLKETDDADNLLEFSSALFKKRSCDSTRSSQSSIPDAMEVTKVHDSNDSVVEDSYQYSVWVSFIEVYNEQVYDLLTPVISEKGKRNALKLSEDSNQNIYVKGVAEIMVTSAEEAYQLLLIGQKNLKFASTKLNYNSSRSHCVFTMKLMKIEQGSDRCTVVKAISRLSFCDLAGSERTSKTENVGERVRETGNINSSLLTLGRCINALRWNQIHKKEIPRVIPFRDSKLTRLFQNFLTGSGKSSMIVNISQAASYFDETVHVLKFSAVAKQIITVQKPTEMPLQIVSQVTAAVTLISTSEVCSSTNCSQIPITPEIECGDEEGLLDKTLGDNPVEREYLRIIDVLKNKLIAEKQLRLKQETEIREEVCREVSKQMAQMDKNYSEYCQGALEDAEDLADERLELYIQTVQKKQKSEKRMTLDCGENEDDEWVSSALLRAEEERVKEREAEIQKLKGELAELRKQNAQNWAPSTSDALSIEVPIIRRIQDSVGSLMSVDSLETGISGSSIEMKSQTGPPDMERLQSIIEKQKREIKDLSEMLKEAGETFSLKETQLSKLEEELKISEEYSMQQVKVMQESQTALDEIRAQLEKALEKMQTKDATICELEQQVANLTNAKGAQHYDLEMEKKHLKKVEQLSKALREAENERDKLRSEVGDLNEQLSSAVFDCDTLRLHEQTLEEKIKRAEETIKAQKAKITDIEEQLKTQNEQLHLTMTALEKSDEKCQELTKAIDTEKSAIQMLKKNEDWLQTELSRTTQNLVGEQKFGEELKQKLGELDVKLHQVTVELEALLKQKVEADNSLEELRGSLAAANLKVKEADTAKAEARVLHEDLNETKFALTTARTEVIDLKRRMLDHGDEIQLLKNELLTTGGALRRTEESLATERKNNERIIEDHKRNEAVILELKKGLDVQDQVAEKLEAILSEKKAAIECLSEELNALKQKETILEKECQQAKQSRRDFDLKEKECEDLKKRFNETSVVCNDLGVQVDNLRVELAKQIKLTEMKESQLVSLAAKVASLEKEENRGDSDGQSAKLPPVSTNKRRTKASAAPSVAVVDQQQVDLTPSITKAGRSMRSSSSRNMSPINDESEPPDTKSTAKRKNKKGPNSRPSSSMSSNQAGESSVSPPRPTVSSTSGVLRKTSSRKRKSAACNTEESEPSGFAKVDSDVGQLAQPDFGGEEQKPQRSRRTAAATARDAMLAMSVYLHNSPVGPHIGTIAKQSVEYVITGSPVAEPVVDESEVPPSKKKKRILYTSPHKKLSFSPVESSSRDFVGFRSKDPVEVVQRQVKATGAASKRSTRAHSKAAE